MLTWALCSRAENYNNLRRPDDGVSAVAIGNPATAEFQVCRTTLLAGALASVMRSVNVMAYLESGGEQWSRVLSGSFRALPATQRPRPQHGPQVAGSQLVVLFLIQ